MAAEEREQRWYATGKRKTAVARVWLKAGTGNIRDAGGWREFRASRSPAPWYFESLAGVQRGAARSLEARRVPDARRSCQRTQEVWTTRSAQAFPILQTITKESLSRSAVSRSRTPESQVHGSVEGDGPRQWFLGSQARVGKPLSSMAM
jgi:hypothetical protein